MPLPRQLRNYALVTFAYWSFTLTDGALRMLVLLHFHRLGFSPLSLATLFLLYEMCGVLTSLIGGWLGGRFGLKLTLLIGLGVQVGTLILLGLLQPDWLVATQVLYVFLAQGASGIAKDFTKISAKSAIRILVPADTTGQSTLFRWVALLTGSKNTLKGVGFFLGAWLLAGWGFAWSLFAMAAGLAFCWLCVFALLAKDLGKAKAKAKFTSLLSKSAAINQLSLARFFLFGARDIWFAVALPVYLYQELAWSFVQVGSYMATWVIGYGIVQATSSRFLKQHTAAELPRWGAILASIPICMIGALVLQLPSASVVLIGLSFFALVFAVNSTIHSYLILDLADQRSVAMDVGFYYMANAGGRLYRDPTFRRALSMVWPRRLPGWGGPHAGCCSTNRKTAGQNYTSHTIGLMSVVIFKAVVPSSQYNLSGLLLASLLVLVGCAGESPPLGNDAEPGIGPDAAPIPCNQQTPLVLKQCIDEDTAAPCLDFVAPNRSWISLKDQPLVRPIIGLQGSPMFVLAVSGKGIEAGTNSDSPFVNLQVTMGDELVGAYEARPTVIPDPDASGSLLAPQLYVVAFLADKMAGQQVQIRAEVEDRNDDTWCSEGTFQIGLLQDAPPLP